MAGREDKKKGSLIVRLPKCFTLPQDSLKDVVPVEAPAHWFWKLFYVGNYYGRSAYVKQIPRPIDDAKQVQTFQSIGALLTDIHHPNIVQFLGVISAPHYQTWSVVTENLERGDLATLLKSTIKLSYAQIISILLDVACAMAYLHGQSPPMLHRDLRAVNVHITHDFRAKITNFELAGQLGLNKALVGTPAWVAPEIMRRDVEYTEKIDVYSFAMLMVEIVNAQTPYSDETIAKAELLRQVADQGKRPKVMNREELPRDFVQLMERCWSDDAAERPSFMAIMNELQKMSSNVREQ